MGYLIALISCILMAIAITVLAGLMGYAYVVEGYGLHPAACVIAVLFAWGITYMVYVIRKREIQRQRWSVLK